MLKIEIDTESYIDLLNDRRRFVVEHFNWRDLPESMWEFCMDFIRECGILGDASPHRVVDNLIVNGDWGFFDDYKDPDESDESFIKRIDGNCLAFNSTERWVIFSW